MSASHVTRVGPDRGAPPWRVALGVAVWVVGIGYFTLVVLLLLGRPAGVSAVLEHRWLLWLVGVGEVAAVLALRFVTAWNEPVPAVATTPVRSGDGAPPAIPGSSPAAPAVRAGGGPVWPERLFSWLFAYPLIPLQIAAFWAVSWLGFGEGLGLPDLVWEDGWWPRFFAGLSVSLLIGNALFIRALLDRRPGNTPPDFGESWSLFGGSADPDVRRVGTFLTVTWLPALAVFYLPKMTAWAEWKEMGAAGSMAGGLAAGVGVAVLMWFVYEYLWRDGWADRLMYKIMPAFHGATPLPRGQWPLHSLAGLLAIHLPLALAALFLLEHLFFDAVWSPVWLLCLILALFNSAYGFITFQLAGLQYVLVVLVGMVVFVSNTEYPDKMTFPGLEDYTAREVNLNDPPPFTPPEKLDLIGTPDLLATFHNTKWANGAGKGDSPPDRRKPRLVIVCTTGGGIQASVWTAVVLQGLEAQIPGGTRQAAFRDHVRMITGASGGMQAAALYAADFDERASNASLDRQLTRDSLWPTVQTMLAHDLTGLAWPRRYGSDRGRTLEAAWEYNCRPWRDREGNPCDPPGAFGRAAGGYQAGRSPLAKTFWEIRTAERACDRPTLVFSPMLVEDCRRLLVSNLSLDWFTHTTANNLNPATDYLPEADRDLVSIPAIELWRYFPLAREKFTVGTAARMSATFPFVGPAVSLPSNPPRRVVDAGYFDNFGINMAAMWLYRYREEIRRHTSGVVIVEVRAYKRREEKLRFELGAETKEAKEKKAELFTWAMSEVSSPLEAIINLYARGAYFRNDQLLHVLDREFNAPPTTPPGAAREDKFFATVAFECGQPAALSWTLPERDARRIRESFTRADGTLHADVRQQVEALKRWFGDGGTR